MITFTALESEFVRTILYGSSKKRRKESILLPLLQSELKERADKRISELKSIIEAIRQFGREAEALAKAGKKEDSLEYDSIQQKALNHSELTQSYMRWSYVEALSPKNTDNPENEPATKEQLHNERETADLHWPTEWRCPKWISQDGKSKPGQPQTPGECMYQYCYFGLWEPGTARNIYMTQQIENYKKYCNDPLMLEKDRKIADNWISHAAVLMKKAKKKHPNPDVMSEAKKMQGPLSAFIKKQIQKKEDRAERGKIMAHHHVSISAVSPIDNGEKIFAAVPSVSEQNYPKMVYTGHKNDICSLAPSPEWELYIDESGTDDTFNTGGTGVIAGVLMSKSQPLPPQPQLHASSDKTESQMKAGDKVIETLLKNPQTGVLAVPARIYQDISGWGELIVSFIDLVLRMLPLGGKKTKLTVYVEGRSPYDSVKDFTFMQDACRYQLIHTLPARAKLLKFQICQMDKQNPMNAYPDLVAHSCFMRKGNPVAKARFNASGWNGTCFLNYSSMQICNFLDYFHAGRTLQPIEWEELVQQLDSPSPNFISSLLQLFGEEIRKDVDLWKTFLDFFISHLDSKAINMRKLEKQVAFLKRYQPEDAVIPLRLRLMWLTAKLAEANHRGCATVENEKDYRELISTLFAEDAPLTCWAVLHLAVNYTNAYDFKSASDIVEAYLDIMNKAIWGDHTPDWLHSTFDVLDKAKQSESYGPAAITGLKYFAQLISTHGQHLAFEGKNEEASAYFEEAIRLFSKLSFKEDKDLEISQTTAYLVTSMMDFDSNPERMQNEAEKYFGANLSVAVKELTKDVSDENKYRHHILLRYALSGKAPDSIKADILATEKEWQTGNGHPWEMIEFYRALLVSDPAERVKHLRKAHDLSQGYDATLHVIDSVILGALLLDDSSMIQQYKELVEQCAKELPALQDRIQILRQQPERKLSPLELAKAILPFNFR